MCLAGPATKVFIGISGVLTNLIIPNSMPILGFRDHYNMSVIDVTAHSLDNFTIGISFIVGKETINDIITCSIADCSETEKVTAKSKNLKM